METHLIINNSAVNAELSENPLDPISVQTLVDTMTDSHAMQGHYGDYMDGKKTRVDECLPSNNSSRTFCERSTSHSPLTGKETTDTLNSMPCQFDNCNVPYGFHEHSLDSGYQPSPFHFQYDGNQDDYLRYRNEPTHGLYNTTPQGYEMSYMQHLSQLSSHMDDTQSHCTIPLGKRRPRALMISGDSQSMNQKLYDGEYDPNRLMTPNDKTNQFNLHLIPPSRYYYPPNSNPYGTLSTNSMVVAKPRSDSDDALLNDHRHSVFNFETPPDDVLVIPQPVVTANLAAHDKPLMPSKSKLKTLGKRQKHVRRACIHCKKAHLACDEARPCKRCVHLGKTDCVDVEHKRRGRPRTSPEKKRVIEKTEADFLLRTTHPYENDLVAFQYQNACNPVIE